MKSAWGEFKTTPENTREPGGEGAHDRLRPWGNLPSAGRDAGRPPSCRGARRSSLQRAQNCGRRGGGEWVGGRKYRALGKDIWLGDHKMNKASNTQAIGQNRSNQSNLTESHRISQNHTDSHRITQNYTESHRITQIPTDPHRIEQSKTQNIIQSRKQTPRTSLGHRTHPKKQPNGPPNKRASPATYSSRC